MIKRLFIMLILTCSTQSWAQVEKDTLDYKYLEDQLYLSANYNILRNKPVEDENSLFAVGIELGFIKDIPFNKQRNIGIGIGLGYAFNTYKNTVNLYTDEFSSAAFEEEFKTNKFSANLVEIPFELRWRTSTASKYSFWRVYGGLKFSYTFLSSVELSHNGEVVKRKNLKALNDFKYGAILSAGYGTWNVNAYYGLSQLFSSVNSNGEELNLKDFSIGLKFYIL
jgi:hypothetical protein